MRRNNLLLYLAIFIPLIMIAIVTIAVFYPGNRSYPKQNFLYAIYSKDDDYYYCSNLVRAKFFPNDYKTYNKQYKQRIPKCTPEYYIYDFNKLDSSKISLNDALKLKITEKNDSAEGFSISGYCNPGSSFGWWWSSGDYDSVCLRKKTYQERLNITAKDGVFIFIGWITDEGKSHAKT